MSNERWSIETEVEVYSLYDTNPLKVRLMLWMVGVSLLLVTAGMLILVQRGEL